MNLKPKKCPVCNYELKWQKVIHEGMCRTFLTYGIFDKNGEFKLSDKQKDKFAHLFVTPKFKRHDQDCP